MAQYPLEPSPCKCTVNPWSGDGAPRGGVAHCLVLGRRGQPTGRDGCSAAGPHSDEAGGTCGARCCPGAQRGRAADARFARSLDHTDGLWLSQRCRSWAHPGTGFGGPQPAADGWSKDPWQRRPLTPLPGIIDMAGPRGHPRRPRPPAKVVARLGNAGVGGVCGAALEHPPLATPLLHQERSSTATTSEEGSPPIAGPEQAFLGGKRLNARDTAVTDVRISAIARVSSLAHLRMLGEVPLWPQQARRSRGGRPWPRRGAAFRRRTHARPPAKRHRLVDVGLRALCPRRLLGSANLLVPVRVYRA